MALEAETSRLEAAAAKAAVTTKVDTLRTEILGVVDALQRAADQLLDHVLAEQIPWVRETVERLAPLVDERLTQGQAAAGAVLGQATRMAPHVAAARQHPWLLVGGALLVSYLVTAGGSHAPTPPPAQPRHPQTPPASDQP